MNTFEDSRPYYGEDPFIATGPEGQCFYIESQDEKRVQAKLVSSLDPQTWHTAPEYTLHEDPNEHQLWAPELHCIEEDPDQPWIILYSFSKGENRTHRVHKIQNGISTQLISTWSIDATTFRYNNQRYLVYSGWEPNQTEEFPQSLYIANWQTPHLHQQISTPTLSWEGQINEGPQFIDHPDFGTGLLYSANASWTQDYCTGFLELIGANPNPLNPAHWAKDFRPLAKNTGHAQFIPPNGLLYHRKLSPLPGWADREVIYDAEFFHYSDTD